jgi:hypothetical protein
MQRIVDEYFAEFPVYFSVVVRTLIPLSWSLMIFRAFLSAEGWEFCTGKKYKIFHTENWLIQHKFKTF